MRHRVSGFVHFGVNTFTGDDGIEWGDGHASPAAFDPADLDCGQWADSFRAAGIRVTFTAKHHDGFCLWPSRYSDYTVAGSPWRGGHGDLVSEFVEAMRRRGIRVGLYLSPADIRSYLDGHCNNGSPRLDTTIPTLAEGDVPLGPGRRTDPCPRSGSGATTSTATTSTSCTRCSPSTARSTRSGSTGRTPCRPNTPSRSPRPTRSPTGTG